MLALLNFVKKHDIPESAWWPSEILQKSNIQGEKNDMLQFFDWKSLRIGYRIAVSYINRVKKI